MHLVIIVQYYIQQSLSPLTPSRSLLLQRSSSRPSCYSLPLVRHLDELGAVADGHAGRVLLGRDGARLGLVLDEGDALAAGHEAHLAETFEAAEDGGEGLDVVVVG